MYASHVSETPNAAPLRERRPKALIQHGTAQLKTCTRRNARGTHRAPRLSLPDAVLVTMFLDPQAHTGDHVQVLRLRSGSTTFASPRRVLLDVGLWVGGRSVHARLRLCGAHLVVARDGAEVVDFCRLVECGAGNEWRRQRRRGQVVDDDVQAQVHPMVVECLGERGELPVFR